jgi:hypothetical protein
VINEGTKPEHGRLQVVAVGLMIPFFRVMKLRHWRSGSRRFGRSHLFRPQGWKRPRSVEHINRISGGRDFGDEQRQIVQKFQC